MQPAAQAQKKISNRPTVPMIEESKESTQPSWAPGTVVVRRALAFIRRRGGRVGADELVAWDAANGRRLFNWDDKTAAQQWRLQQARMFLNSFRGVVNGMRVRAFINVPATEETERQYYGVEEISDTPILRERVVSDIVRRIKVLASELKMWRLSPAEIASIIAQLQAELMG